MHRMEGSFRAFIWYVRRIRLRRICYGTNDSLLETMVCVLVLPLCGWDRYEGWQGRWGVSRLNRSIQQRGSIPLVKCTISEYILLSRFKCPVGFLHIIFSIPFIPIYQSKGRLSWTIKDTFCSRPSSKEGSRMESKGIRVINCQYQLQAALPY